MDLSGIIFVLLALAWACYLIPKAVKHHEDAVRSRSVDRFSTAMRVLARREPDDRGESRVVVTPARSAERVLLPARPGPEPAEPVRETQPAARSSAAPVPSVTARPSAAARRAAARAAARRRRHVLLVLLVADLATVGACAFTTTPWWAVAVPVALTAAYLVLCRSQVRREDEALWESREPAEIAPRRAIRVDASYVPAGTAARVAPAVERSPAVEQAPAAEQMPAARESGETEFSDDEDTIAIPVAELEAVAVAVETSDGGSLWDPLPVTLPTYVGKARASRTVRTIDLGAPGSWTSGRDEADSALVEQTAADESAGVRAEQAKAVGS